MLKNYVIPSTKKLSSLELAETLPTIALSRSIPENSSSVEHTEAPAATSPPTGVNGAANRAPGIPLIPIFSSLLPTVEIHSAEVQCYGLSGDGVEVPAWVLSLLSYTEGGYEQLNKALENPWNILLVWVPSKFMSYPQPHGVNSQGVKFEAPTRGRDPLYYTKEYNATWHLNLNFKKGEYHVQVLHKNALAVCIRERLHINYFKCGVSQERLLPMYSCACRHCVEPTVGKTKGKILPTVKKETYKPSVPSVTVNNPNRTCVPALAAPWLFPVEVLPIQSYERLQPADLEELLAAVADKNRVVLVYIFNKFWVDHMHNCIFSMVYTTGLRNYIIATMDQESFNLCRINRLPCFDATAYAEPEADMKVDGAGYKSGATRKVSEAMSWIKPRLAVAILKLGYAFFMADLDMTWFKNPMNNIWKQTEDVTHQCDTVNINSVNSGFYLAKPTQAAITFFEHLQVFRPEENADQTAMKLFFRYDHTHGATHSCLNNWLYDMKCNYKVEGSVRKEKSKYGGSQTFSWRPQQRDRSKMNSFILHATCLSGAVAKMIYLRTNNAWLLDDLDRMTSKTYCATQPDGRVVQGLSGKTQHSVSYTREVDPYFLKERH